MRRTSTASSTGTVPSTEPTRRVWKGSDTGEWKQHTKDKIITDVDEPSVRAAVFLLTLCVCFTLFLELYYLLVKGYLIFILWHPIIQENPMWTLPSFLILSVLVALLAEEYFFIRLKRNHILRCVYKIDPFTRCILDRAVNSVYSAEILKTLDEEVLQLIEQYLDPDTGKMGYFSTKTHTTVSHLPPKYFNGDKCLPPFQECIKKRPTCTRSLQSIRKMAIGKMCDQITLMIKQNAPNYGYYTITTTCEMPESGRPMEEEEEVRDL